MAIVDNFHALTGGSILRSLSYDLCFQFFDIRLSSFLSEIEDRKVRCIEPSKMV